MTPEVKKRIEQMRRGEVPNGYKKVKKAISPIEWEYGLLSDIASISQGYTFSRDLQGKSKGDWNYFKVADIGMSANAKYLRQAVNMIDDTVAKSIGAMPFEAGSIVFPRVGAALFNNNKKIIAQDSIVDDNVLVITIKNKKFCCSEFLYYVLFLVRLEDWCNAGLVPVISSKTVLKHQICLPALFEQQKIAEILTAQDKIIELKEKLLTEKQRQKKYLMQQLLTGKTRLPGFNGEWETIGLRKMLVSGNKQPVSDTAVYQKISVKLNFKGIEYAKFNREMADTRPFYVRKENEIVIGKQNYFNGSIALVTRKFDGCICSNAIMSFSVHNANLYFIFQYLSMDGFLKSHQMIANGTGQKELSEKDFLDFSVTVPSIDEQTAIAKILSTADRELDLLRQSIEQEKQKKKALMQLLLTGIVRVKP